MSSTSDAPKCPVCGNTDGNHVFSWPGGENIYCYRCRSWFPMEEKEMAEERAEEGVEVGMMGWICPVCGAGLSPWTERCGCVPWPQPVSVTVTGPWPPEGTGDTYLGSGEQSTPNAS